MRVEEDIPCVERDERVEVSQRSSTPAARSARATEGHVVSSRSSCTMRVSAALQAAG